MERDDQCFYYDEIESGVVILIAESSGGTLSVNRSIMMLRMRRRLLERPVPLLDLAFRSSADFSREAGIGGCVGDADRARY